MLPATSISPPIGSGRVPGEALVGVDQDAGVLDDVLTGEELGGDNEQQRPGVAGRSMVDPPRRVGAGDRDILGGLLGRDPHPDRAEGGSHKMVEGHDESVLRPGPNLRRRGDKTKAPGFAGAFCYLVSLCGWCVRHQRQYFLSSMRSRVLVLFLTVT